MFGRNFTSPTNSDVVEPSKNLLSEHKEFLSNSVLLDRILKHRSTTTTPMSMTMSAQDFYTNLDFMMLEWKRSLSKRNVFSLFLFSFLFLNFDNFRRSMRRFRHCFYQYRDDLSSSLGCRHCKLFRLHQFFFHRHFYSNFFQKKPSYMIPYFLIKVFNVVMAILSVLGFYAYLPNVTSWLYMHPNFPLRHFLLGLDNQTLQLLFFAFLLLLILVKVKM